MRQAAETFRVMCPLFQTGKGGSQPTSPLQLRFDVADLAEAIALNAAWHSRLPKLPISSVLRNVRHQAYAAHAGGLFYAVAIWSSPVARLLPANTYLELRRFAIAPDAPKNTASRMLGWMARDIRKRLPAIEVLVSYQDKDVHTGTIYRAAGWQPVTLADPRSRPWSNKNRQRNPEQSRSPKQRWQKNLTP